MDGTFLIAIAVLVAVHIPDWQTRRHQKRAVARQQKRDDYARRGQELQRQYVRQQERDRILSRLHDNEIPISEEAFHASR